MDDQELLLYIKVMMYYAKLYGVEEYCSVRSSKSTTRSNGFPLPLSLFLSLSSQWLHDSSASLSGPLDREPEYGLCLIPNVYFGISLIVTCTCERRTRLSDHQHQHQRTRQDRRSTVLYLLVVEGVCFVDRSGLFEGKENSLI